MGKTSSNQEKKKKTKVRKLINRANNGLQHVRKFCRQHVFPVVLSACILVGVIFGFYYKAYATGMTELYMTYWDLYNSIFASTGYSMKIKDGAEDYNNANRVTGKQAWHNFCEYVKIHAKDVYNEAVALPKYVTVEGIKMSQDLWKAAQDYAATFASSSGTVSYKSLKSVQDALALATGLDGKHFNGTCIRDIASGKNDLYCLNFIQSNGNGRNDYFVFGIPSGATFVDFEWNYFGTRMRYITPDGDEKSCESDVYEVLVASATDIRCWDYQDMSWTFRDTYKDCAQNWLIKGGVKVKEDEPPIITDPARQLPEKVREDEYIPWLTWADLDAKMREATNDNEDKSHKDDDNDDNDKDKNGKSWKDIIPALIPFNPKTPSTTEKENDKNKDTEKSTESDSKKNPMINPDTGRYIDPDTGYDIDPDTGKLIDPDTGELIEPDIPSTAGKAGNWKRLFPFCIPWDMMELIKSMQADKKAPVFEFKYTFKAVNYTWVVRVDMSDYWKYIKIFRWGMTIFFIIGLFFLTVKFTTFVQRMGG